MSSSKMKTIDHYGYWYRKKEKKNLLHREKAALDLIENLDLSRNSVFLDAGCGDGRFMKIIKRLFGFEVFGTEYSKEAIKICKNNGIGVKHADLNKKIPYKNNQFDILYAGELIEHLYDPDKFLMESNRVLKNKGYIIITTPNLCSFYNRLLMLCGIQPIFIETSTRNSFVGAGILKSLKKDPNPVGHVRIFNYTSLKDILELYGFRIIKIKGARFEHFPKGLWFLDTFFALFPRLSSELVISARKIKDI